MTTLYAARNVTKRYPIKRNGLGRTTEHFNAVDGVSLDVAEGETLAVVGESGAGKSTLGRILLRLIEPDHGELQFQGVDLRRLRAAELRRARAKMQMIFQDPYSSFDPRMTIGQSLEEPMRALTDLPRAERRRRVATFTEQVGLTADHLVRYPSELSGGQLQRLAIARALTTEPALIVCDEPVAALDVSVRAQVLNLLRDLQRSLGVAYVFVTHDLSLVSALADRVAVMRRGQIVEIGDTDHIFEAPGEAYTRELLASIPVPDPHRRRLQAAPSAPRDAIQPASIVV